MAETMVVKFWGVRGSYPVPGIETVRYGGNTACVEVRAGGQMVILDAGTGVINLGRDLSERGREAGQSVQAALFFSHMHQDHIQGFPFFAPAMDASTRLYIFGPDLFELEQVLERSVTPPFFPLGLREMGATKTFRSIHENQVVLLGGVEASPRVVSQSEAEDVPGAVRVRAMRSNTHPGTILIYRVEWQHRAMVYATDTEGMTELDPRLVEFARGADLLIHDAQYTRQHYQGQLPGFSATHGWGHSTPDMACDVAREAGVPLLALFHHEPRYDDATLAIIEAETQKRYAGAFAAYEGLEINLNGSNNLVPTPPPSLDLFIEQT